MLQKIVIGIALIGLFLGFVFPFLISAQSDVAVIIAIGIAGGVVFYLARKLDKKFKKEV